MHSLMEITLIQTTSQTVDKLYLTQL